MIYYEYRNSNGDVLADNLADCPGFDSFRGKESQNVVIGDYRNIFAKDDLGSVRLIFDQPRYVNSSRQARLLLDGRMETLGWVLGVAERNVIRTNDTLRLFAHNLTTVFAQLKGKIQRVFTEDIYKLGDYERQRVAVRLKLQRYPDKSADDYCQMAKRIDDLGAQIEGFKLLSGVESVLNLGRYDFMRITLRFAQPFFFELRGKKVKIKFEGSEKRYTKLKPLLDTKLISLALNHFFHNVVKYCAPESDVTVSVDEDDTDIKVHLDMISVQICDDERERILSKGYSGKYAEDKKGEGLGLFVAKKALERFGADIIVPPCKDEDVVTRIEGVPYCNNRFTFLFPKVH